MKKLKWFLLAGLIPLFLPVLIIIIPVSYTHLDVYKRQEYTNRSANQ